ncbi:MAG: (Fe-S)-binding protein, partial [Dehalococcoidia bacterium]
CPTYLETGLEPESPRGRIYLIKAASQGRIPITANVIRHLDLCLQCRNCESACPSGVPYGRIMEQTRATIIQNGQAPLSWLGRMLVLRHLIAHPGRLRLAMYPLQLYNQLGLPRLVERAQCVGFLPRKLYHLATLAPRPARRIALTPGTVMHPPSGMAQRRVGVLVGCVMPWLYDRVNVATARVLARNGCEVVAPAGQVCCGALHAHNGDRVAARRLARRNIDAFLAAGVDAIVVNSAGCGSAMKEYAELLHSDRRYAERARCFSAMVRDVSEFLAELPFEKPTGVVSGTVTYQDSCHLAHAQRIAAPPRAILNAIPGLRLVEMEHADLCCGSAGIYSVTQGEMSGQLLRRKMREVAQTGAQIIATANPGCMMQLETGLRRYSLAGQVAHVVELLDQSYRAGEGNAHQS